MLVNFSNFYVYFPVIANFFDHAIISGYSAANVLSLLPFFNVVNALLKALNFTKSFCHVLFSYVFQLRNPLFFYRNYPVLFYIVFGIDFLAGEIQDIN